MPPMSQTSSETSAPPSAQQRWQGASSFLLFLLLLGSLVLYPDAENSTFGYYALRVLATTAIVLGVYVVSFQRSLIVICHPRCAVPGSSDFKTGRRLPAQGLSINRQSSGFGSRIRRVPELACAALSRSRD